MLSTHFCCPAEQNRSKICFFHSFFYETPPFTAFWLGVCDTERGKRRKETVPWSQNNSSALRTFRELPEKYGRRSTNHSPYYRERMLPLRLVICPKLGIWWCRTPLLRIRQIDRMIINLFSLSDSLYCSARLGREKKRIGKKQVLGYGRGKEYLSN